MALEDFPNMGISRSIVTQQIKSWDHSCGNYGAEAEFKQNKTAHG